MNLIQKAITEGANTAEEVAKKIGEPVSEAAFDSAMAGVRHKTDRAKVADELLKKATEKQSEGSKE